MNRFFIQAIVFLLLLPSISYAEKVSIFGSLKNGTFGGPGKADSIKLLALQSAMLPLAEIGPQTGSFRFPAVEAPEGSPLLVQVVYKGVNYNKIIPPVAKFRSASQEVQVFEIGNDWKDVSVKSLMQVMREKTGVRIFKLFLLDNASKPPRSFQTDTRQIEYFVPKEAKEVFAQVQQPGSKMAIPLGQPEGKNGGKILDRALLPGVSELQISYLIPNEVEVITEQLLLEGESGSYPIFLKPEDMKPEIVSGGTLTRLEKDIPPGLSAYSLIALDSSKIVKLKFVGGKAVPTMTNSSPEIVNGTILTSWDSSLFAVIGFVSLLFTLSFVFVYRKSLKKET
ncbi:hypothetical protein [Leptospira ilyithenensis]|uniref:Uncharacterized protein n=1 Tax=Leptospira ilyithenensis TaxID=2484901 RepID=A0A4R9LW62_9LEPT|nr:hypothetical protein [Leptospira ilyithenensis]TGN14270.1 hypothetical protein EHS11_01980 [Leptospira ilyithenensis]